MMEMEFAVIDTDVVSYLFKGDTRGDLYQPHLDNKLGVLSFMTVAELDLWAATRNWGMKKREELALFLSAYIVIESMLIFDGFASRPPIGLHLPQVGGVSRVRFHGQIPADRVGGLLELLFVSEDFGQINVSARGALRPELQCFFQTLFGRFVAAE